MPDGIIFFLGFLGFWVCMICICAISEIQKARTPQWEVFDDGTTGGL